ncbi:MAG: 16S rRNA (adenine(1518)-N(6)/adenine(1519)-N(6))-dimethyltransferase RsmA [Desulfobulbaceae bacterium]|nr:16S rRNA (adenine(1518)-N(6)/adenine(1519)-N(6))-dimethyltransferase RsmA [Desulfobulbaceae bacterium]HIJ78846.1 ribosomal RNA small subunit methyltransferase A [Deltaproteobacteria bacterium]
MNPEKSIKNILKSQKLAPSKKLGQNFLVHRQTSERIVELAEVTTADTIIELGVGLGSLTQPLAEKVGRVIGIELDSGIIEYHQQKKVLPDNVSLIHQDLLKSDFHDLAAQSGGKLKIMANLPYSISNPLLFKLIETRDSMAWAVLMLQKEVGQRLTAEVGTKNYGVLSVLLAACASVKTLMQVGPGNFHPRPKVDSVVVKIIFDPVPERVAKLAPHDSKLLRKLVNAAFQQRRKTLINALSSANLEGLDKEALAQLLPTVEIDPKIRAERLTIEDYIRLTNAVENWLKNQT